MGEAVSEPAETDSPPLDAVNASFHDAYEAARDDARSAVPVLVVLADTITLLHGARRQAIEFTPELFHVIKSVVHAPVAVYVAAMGPAPRPDLAKRVRAARAALHRYEPHEPAIVERLAVILDATLAFLQHPEHADAFARSLGPRLLRSADDATLLQLAALDAATGTLLDALAPTDRANVNVVVAGAHQARARSLGMQYFGKLLGDDAALRLAYAESVETEEEAVQLVGMRRVDRLMGHAFFGDAERLGRDVLGDSVKARLRNYTLTASDRLCR